MQGRRKTFEDDIDAVLSIAAVPKILSAIRNSTGLWFVAVARVTQDRWIACQVHDEIECNLPPGGELTVARSATRFADIVTLSRSIMLRRMCQSAFKFGSDSCVERPDSAIEAGVPKLVDARNSSIQFHAMIRKRIESDLDPWLIAAKKSLIASFASGVSNDRASVKAAMVQPWSNGQTKGQINKLKMVNRQMYGRA